MKNALNGISSVEDRVSDIHIVEKKKERKKKKCVYNLQLFIQALQGIIKVNIIKSTPL